MSMMKQTTFSSHYFGVASVRVVQEQVHVLVASGQESQTEAINDSIEEDQCLSHCSDRLSQAFRKQSGATH